MEMANPLLESFGEPPRTCVTKSSRPPPDLKEKENPELPSVCSNYWPPIKKPAVTKLRLCRFSLYIWHNVYFYQKIKHSKIGFFIFKIMKFESSKLIFYFEITV